VSIVSGVGYEPFGPLNTASYGNGVTLAQGYDQDYELTSIAAAAGTANIQNLSYSYDPSGNITDITDSLASGRTQTLAYDDLNRLWCATGVYGTQAYTYDGVGNRTSGSFGGTITTCPTMSGGTVSTYAIASGANRISTITTGSSVRTFGYLASGQVSGDQRTATSDYTFAYNNDGRMQTASLNSSGVGSYVYNGFEQRAQKTAASAVTDFIFDRFGHLLAEANDATGAMLLKIGVRVETGRCGHQWWLGNGRRTIQEGDRSGGQAPCRTPSAGTQARCRA
jgi:YD repeat-containing protein